MKMKFLRKYGKITAAAVFLTVAGFCYGCAENSDETLELSGPNVLEARTEQVCFDENDHTEALAAGYIAEATMPMCFVHICGEVKVPGVYELPEGSRVFEAVKAAGGFTEEASEESLNLAGVIADGMQIVILSKEEADQSQAEAKAQEAGLININKASKEQLMTLPGIGESRAEDIIRYREDSGGFQKIEDIMKVSGIKDAAFQKIKDSIVV